MSKTRHEGAPLDGLPTPSRPKAVSRRGRRGTLGRAARRPEEDIPNEKYMRVLERLGPRPNESLLAYEKRMGAVRAARRFVEHTWRDNFGDKARVALALGIARGSLAQELRVIGLSAAILDSALRNRVVLD